jgi:hypothetical protein
MHLRAFGELRKARLWVIPNQILSRNMNRVYASSQPSSFNFLRDLSLCIWKEPKRSSMGASWAIWVEDLLHMCV